MPRVDFGMVTSALELPGYRIVRNFGIVRGIIVARERDRKSRRGVQTIIGGNITILTNLCEKTREDAFETYVAARRRTWRQCRHRNAV